MIKKISDEILSHGKAYNNLRYLTKQIGGRLAGSPQMVKAEQWGLKIMKESGADKAWMQEFENGSNSGRQDDENKDKSLRVRAIRSF